MSPDIDPGSPCHCCDQMSGCGFHDITEEDLNCTHKYCVTGRRALVQQIHNGRYHVDELGFALVHGGPYKDLFRISFETGEVFVRVGENYIPVGFILKLD